MHHSRLSALVIDCEGGDLDQAAAFWSAVLGRPIEPRPESASPQYRTLRQAKGELALLLQRVDHPSRVHLDLEADDVEAEVRRLEALGARRVAQVKTWWVLEAPTGHRFCVVPGEPGDDANRWP